MFRNLAAAIILYTLVFSFLAFQPAPVLARDLVATESITGGASAFVFRGSAKKPQSRSGFVSQAGGGSVIAKKTGRKVDGRAASIARKKRKLAAAQAAANARIKLSNTLTARAEGQIEKGETDIAITNYREAIKQNARNARAKMGLSDALTAKGIDVAGESGSDAALAFLEEAVKLNDKNEIAYAKLGEIHYAQNRNAKAVASFEKALQIDSQFPSVYLPAALAYLDAGDIAKADAWLTKAEQSGFNNSESQYARGVILYNQYRNDDALAAFNRMLQSEPTNAAAMHYQGLIYERTNQPDQSLASLKRAVELDPGFARAWFDLGISYYNRGMYQEAAAAYLRGLKIDPYNAQGHWNLAGAYRQLERYPEANAEYRIAAESIKNDPDLYSEWGFCLGKANEWDRSVERLRSAEQLSPQAIDHTNVGWAYYNSAQIDKENKKEAEAKAKFELGKASLQKAVAANPNLDAAHLNLGSTYNGLGDYNAAVSSFNTAVNLHKDWVIALNGLGFAHRGLNNLTTAIEIFKRVTNLDGNNVFGLFSLGEVYFLSGNKKEAKKIQDRLKKINPAIAGRLSNILDGKAIVDDAKRKVVQKIPKPPIRIPY